jgi:hypothetical protein
MQIMSDGTALGSRSGVRPGDPGLTVTLAGSTINCSAGVAAVAYTGQGVYRAPFPSSVSPGTLTPRTPPSTASTSSTCGLGQRGRRVRPEQGGRRLPGGHPSATPVAPTPAGTQIYMPLATISVPHTWRRRQARR